MPNVNDIHVCLVFEVVNNCVVCAVPSTFMFRIFHCQINSLLYNSNF